jgi:hypothetical protein
MTVEKCNTANGIREIFFRSWDDFKASFCKHLFGSDCFKRGRYLFRGHSHAGWRLQPTFDRMFHSQPKQKRLAIARDLLDQFRRSSEALDLPHDTWKDDSRLLAFGQHYGLPTRLLDWTESPYVASFFAFNTTALWGATDQKIVLWVLDASNPIWSAQYGVEIIDVPSFGNKRIRNQSGKFTLSKTPFAALEDYVDAHGDSDALSKFMIPAMEWSKALSDLDAMGIHHGTMYPENEGAAQMALFRTVVAHNAHAETGTARPA